MNDAWTEISCTVPSELADIVSDFLADLTGSGVCVENLAVDAFSAAEIPESATVQIKSYLPSGGDVAVILAQIEAFWGILAQNHAGLMLPRPEVATVTSQDWSTSWKVNFKPLRVGRRLLIVPSWEEVCSGPDDIVLRIDPGMAFGTGGHETTRLCLELLEEIMDAMPTLVSPAVLDLGTGSGILAMASVQLGAGTVLAVDIDPQAVEVARENLELNGLADQVSCETTLLEELSGQFDVIMANILAEELVRLAGQLCSRLAAGGSLVLSGILTEKEGLVRAGFNAHGLEYVETRRQGEWVAIHYRKGPQP